MGGSKKEIKNDRRSVPIVLHNKEREEWKPNSNLPEGFIPIKINMIKSPGDYQKCINCEERIITSTSIMTTKQMIKKNEITDQIESEKSSVSQFSSENGRRVGKQKNNVITSVSGSELYFTSR